LASLVEMMMMMKKKKKKKDEKEKTRGIKTRKGCDRHIKYESF
jgi:hypothetical protein